MDELTVRTLVAGWRAAEQSLYSLGGGDIERYQRAIRLVRDVADQLVDVETTADLVARWSEAERLVIEALDAAGLPPGSMVADQVAGAAFSLRHQGVVALEAGRVRASRIAAAKEEGAGWVAVHRSQGGGGDYGAPSVEVRMHLPTGLAVQRVHQPSLGADGGPTWSLEVLVLDPATGAQLAGDPPEALATPVDEYATEESARAAEADLVRRVEALDPSADASYRVG